MNDPKIEDFSFNLLIDVGVTVNFLGFLIESRETEFC